MGDGRGGMAVGAIGRGGQGGRGGVGEAERVPGLRLVKGRMVRWQ